MLVSDLLCVLVENGTEYECRGEISIEVFGFSSIYKYRTGTLTWIRDKSKLANICNSDNVVTCIITDNSVECANNAMSQIIVDDPRKAFFDIVSTVWSQDVETSISPLSFIDDKVVIGTSVSIGAYTIISGNVTIGNNCTIGNNVSIKGRVTIGHDTVIQSGAVIGEDGFAFVKETDKLSFIKHFGGVHIGNFVSIGSHTCICRGTIDDTEIDDYVKIDNLCQIAHNVVIGKRTQIIAGAIVMGSVHIGCDCWIAPSIIRDQCSVGNNCTIGMGAIVVKNVGNGLTVIGNPAKPFFKEQKL